jgi:hypothetical protein
MLNKQEHFSVTGPVATRNTTRLSSNLNDEFCVPVNLTKRGFTLFPSASLILFYKGKGCVFCEISLEYSRQIYMKSSLYWPCKGSGL